MARSKTPLSVNVNNVAKHITMEVELRGVRQFRLRMWIGTQLIKLASRIMQVNLEVKK